MEGYSPKCVAIRFDASPYVGIKIQSSYTAASNDESRFRVSLAVFFLAKESGKPNSSNYSKIAMLICQ
jgi:hypothetical protein